MKKIIRVPLIVIGSIAALIAAGLGTTTVVNAVASQREMANLEHYGQLVDVDGKKMNVLVQGDGPETIVMLPGLGTGAPAIDFAPVIDRLASTHRVVAVEPLGYGLSDDTDVPRTSANIVKEVHTALGDLGITKYALMGHSIAGIYALDYINTYPSEVTAFVGIDSSVPNQPGSESIESLESVRGLKSLGLMRVLDGLAPNMYEGVDAYTDAQKEQMAVLARHNALNDVAVSEVGLTAENFAAARAQSFPADFPVLLFVADSDNEEVPGWLELHEEQAATTTNGEVISLKGEHYLHHTQSEAIANDTIAFLSAHPAAK
ncbi:alpha/beta hydrolase [Mycetocola tolaasinivorans]|uniref:Alpha/beta hydrolase n=1 Tax=Mycetocola tolaasinivorans TaxID=76635 RepID=A0A3L7A5J6_9MICO|nr:alpha/beta hydrolase [Mycetocola tolaasinivorans]RLP75325.1 alpha/beta hydrolase [Mycetocola tolaasinivorans]